MTNALEMGDFKWTPKFELYSHKRWECIEDLGQQSNFEVYLGLFF